MVISLAHLVKGLKNTPNNRNNLAKDNLNDMLGDFFDEAELSRIAKDTNFVQRSSSRIKGKEFLQAMLTASIDPRSTPLTGISDNLRGINPRAEMTISALRQRINSQYGMEFLKKIYESRLKTSLQPLSNQLNAEQPKAPKGLLASFSKVFIRDSSTCSLNKRLSSTFKGCGGDCSDSQLKIDLIHDLKGNNIEEVIITDVKRSDQSLSKEVLKHLKKRDLVIQDLGYYNMKFFEDVQQLGAFYLSRLHSMSMVFLNKEDKSPVELGKLLDKRIKKGQVLDIDIYITEKKIKTRLIAYPVPEEVFNKRMRDYRKKSKRKTPLAEWTARQRFTILITNVPREIWPWSIVGTVYKIRWQIELIFKVWKSQLNFDYLQGTKKERIYCLLYAKMIAITIIFTIYNVLVSLSNCLKIELSLPKFVNWLKRNGRFSLIIIKGIANDLWEQLIKGIELLCKDFQRARKPTLKMLEEEVPFLETFKKSRLNNA